MEHDTWKRKEDLGNAKKVLEELEERIDVEIRRQEKIDRVEEQDFRREELPEKFTVRILYK